MKIMQVEFGCYYLWVYVYIHRYIYTRNTGTPIEFKPKFILKTLKLVGRCSSVSLCGEIPEVLPAVQRYKHTYMYVCIQAYTANGQLVLTSIACQAVFGLVATPSNSVRVLFVSNLSLLERSFPSFIAAA